MTTVTAERDIHVPTRIAYDQWTQFESFPRFLSGVVETTQLDDSHVHWKVNVGGVEREFDTEITEQLPNEIIAWRSVRGPLHAGSVRFTPDGTGTHVELELEWEPEGFVEKAGAALGIDNLQVERDLRRFAEFIEHRGTPTGSWREAIDTP
ncbi:MAG TPA: SRPBCC family protein [Microbacteriaceae bacterium]|nr:SRPBCC family protein [Microbacteriaceae bacterium]